MADRDVEGTALVLHTRALGKAEGAHGDIRVPLVPLAPLVPLVPLARVSCRPRAAAS